MKFKNIKILAFVLLSALTIMSCNKDDDPIEPVEPSMVRRLDKDLPFLGTAPAVMPFRRRIVSV